MSQNEKKYNISEARAHFTDIVNIASYAKDRVSITRRNKPIAYVVPKEDIELLEKIEDMADLKEALKRMEEPTITLEDLKKELGL